MHTVTECKRTQEGFFIYKMVFVLFSKYTGEHDYEVLHKLVEFMQLN